MSFMAAAGAIGLTGLGATIGAGAMMGAAVGGVGNLIQGRGLFDNLGQNLLVGGAGAGLMSGIGSAMGGKTLETLTAEAAQPGLDAANQAFAENAVAMPSQEVMDAGSKSITDRFGTFENPILTPAEPLTPTVNSSNTAAINNASYGDSPLATKPAGYDKLYQQTSGLTPPKATLMKNPANYMVQNPSTVAGAVTGLAGLFKQPDPVKQAPGLGGDKYDYAYKPAQYGPDGRVISQASYGTPTVTHYAAAGGSIPGFAEGVYIPQSKRIRTDIYGSNAGPIGESGRQIYKNTDKYAGLKAQMKKTAAPILARLAEDGTDSGISAAADEELRVRASAFNPAYVTKPTMQAAKGGVASLPNEYAAGGKLLQGPGDGMSDSIPAVIKGARPQRAALAQGEFVIPADVVSHLGNGSTDAGAKRLYAMMDKIRHARTGTKKQGRQINPMKFMPA